MNLVDADLLGDFVQLSPGLLIVGLALGLALWLFGWRWHRFWMVLAATVSAGLYGLKQGQALHSQPLLAASLLAVAAGVLALPLVRLLTFLAGGMAGLLIVQHTAAQFDQPLLTFIVAGLVAILLFRWCWMALTSSLGTMLVAYCGLSLAHYYQALDALTWAQETGTLLNWVLAGGGFLGMAFQFLLTRRRRIVVLATSEEGEAGWDMWSPRAMVPAGSVTYAGWFTASAKRRAVIQASE